MKKNKDKTKTLKKRYNVTLDPDTVEIFIHLTEGKVKLSTTLNELLEIKINTMIGDTINK